MLTSQASHQSAVQVWVELVCVSENPGANESEQAASQDHGSLR